MSDSPEGIESTVTRRFVRKAIADLVFLERNSRTREGVEDLERSLEEFGQYRLILIQAGTDVIIGGNHTVEAMLNRGWTHADCEEFEISDERARAMAINDNATGEAGDWNRELLAADLQALDDVTLSGFDQDHLDGLLADLDEPMYDEIVDDLDRDDPSPDAVADVPKRDERAPIRNADSELRDEAVGSRNEPENQALRDREHVQEPEPDNSVSTPPKRDAPPPPGSVTVRRMMTLDLPQEAFDWLADALDEIVEQRDLGSRTEAVLHLVADEVLEDPPSLDPVDSATADGDLPTPTPLQEGDGVVLEFSAGGRSGR